MAANDKLIPTALTLANNLKGTKLYATNTFKLPGKKKSKWENPYIDAVNYFASIYAKEVKVAAFNSTWNHELINGEPQVDPHTLDQNIHHLSLGMVVAFSEYEWDELQITISKAFNIIGVVYSLPAGIYSVSDYAYILSQMGVFSGGITGTLALVDAASNPIPGSPFAQGVAYATAWNNLKVPADKLLDVETQYIAPVYKPTGQTEYFYRFTGIRKWASPFTGYNTN
jgi:hypothetical protein